MNAPLQKLSNADYAKRRRDLARERGDCLQCRKAPRQPGASRCERCIAVHSGKRSADAENQRKRRQEARERGMCGTCCSRRAEAPFKYCAVCLANVNSRRKPQSVAKDICLHCIAIGFHRADCTRST